MFDLKNRCALVTGGTRGLGKAMAQALIEYGADTIITGTSQAVEHTAEQIGAKKGLISDFLDPSKPSECYENAKRVFGRAPDILVNNAGIQRREVVEEFKAEDWHDVMQVNIHAVFTLCQCAGRDMLKKGYGKIINVASLISVFGGYRIPAYATSKGGVMQLTKSLSNAWACRGINVNSIAPGYMATDMNAALLQDENRTRSILERIPAGRWGRPEDVKGVTVFLASTASDYVHGTMIPVDGGYMNA